jgi:hypothetical protein
MLRGDEKSEEFMGDWLIVAAGSELNAWLGPPKEKKLYSPTIWN